MSSKQAATSLLTEHFRYTPLTLIDDIINAVNELVVQAVNHIETFLLNTPPQNLGFADRAAEENVVPETDSDGSAVFPEARPEIENGVHQLETLLEATVDKNFDKLEIYVLRNILTVPGDLVPWVKLDHYEKLDLTPQPNTPAPESLYALRRKYQATKALHTALLTESTSNAALIQQLRAILTAADIKPETASTSANGTTPTQTLSFLTSTPSAKTLGINTTSTFQPLATNTAFVLSQLPALKALTTSLRGKIANLPAPKRADEESTMEQRRTYIENQTRRHLERRGVDLQGGEGEEGLGRRVGAEEVRAMEGILSALQRNGGSGRGGSDGDKMEE